MKLKLGQKNILSIMTLILDILLIYILLNEKLNSYDKNFIYLMLIIHIMFYMSIYNDINKLMEICHIALPILIILGIFVKNIYLLGVVSIYIIEIFITWYIYDDCILKHDEEYNAIYMINKIKELIGIDFYNGYNIPKFFTIIFVIVIIKIIKILL